MKKLFKLAALISTTFVANSAFATDYEWTIASDSVLDGTINVPSDAINVRMHQNHFVFENQADRSVSTVSGHILKDTVDGVIYSTPLISFTIFRADATYEFKGQSIGNGQYQGTWYNNTGESGDFLINTNPSTPEPLPPLDTSLIIVTPSTQYGQHPATAIFNGELGNNNGDVWIGLPDDSGASLHLELPEARTLTGYRLSRGYCSAAAYVAGTWKVYGSTDNVSFTQIDNVAQDQGALMSCTSLNEYTIDTPSSYKYYRIDFEMSSINTYTHTGVAIGEMELIE